MNGFFIGYLGKTVLCFENRCIISHNIIHYLIRNTGCRKTWQSAGRVWICPGGHGPVVRKFHCGQGIERPDSAGEPGVLPVADGSARVCSFCGPGCDQGVALIRRHISYMAVTAFIGVTCFNTFIYIASHTTTAMTCL